MLKSILIIFFGILTINSLAQSDSLVQQTQHHVDSAVNAFSMNNQQIQQSFESVSDDLKEAAKLLEELDDARKNSRKELNKKVKEQYKKCNPCGSEELKKINEFGVSGSKQIDSIYYIGLENAYYQTKGSTIRLFPGRRDMLCQLYYNFEDSYQFLENTSFSLFNDNGSFQTDIVTTFKGPFRVSLGTVLSTGDTRRITANEIKNLSEVQVDSLVNMVDSINKSSGSLLKVISGGGSFVGGLRTPILKIQRPFAEKASSIVTEFVAKGSVDLPLAGNSIETKDAYWFYTLGLENIISIPFKKIDEKRYEDTYVFGMFIKPNIYFVGGSNKFNSNIGIKDNNFFLLGLSAGLEIKNVVIYYSYNKFLNDELTNNNIDRITVSLTKIF